MACGRCGQRIFFDNVVCDACGAALGFVPAELTLVAFELDAEGRWHRLGGAGPDQRPCANYSGAQICNWMVPADSNETLCACCRTTAIIPALTSSENHTAWARIEQAKRRLFYSLISLKLPILNKADDAERGMSFQFLEALTPIQSVLTGHANGVITLNIAEANDAQREQTRLQMHEPYRTLLGHFRHEIGHYYWDRLIRDTPWIAECREIFGDERADYAQALQQHYSAPATDWAQRYVSAYASSHPWEDWAECWAHYMHVQDGLETAAAWGLSLAHAMPVSSGKPATKPKPLDLKAPLEPALIEQWLPVSQFINAMDRCLGTRDSYPFVLPTPVVGKLAFIHKVVAAAGKPARRARKPLARHTSPVC